MKIDNILKFKIFGYSGVVHGISTRFFGTIIDKDKRLDKDNLEKFSKALGVDFKRMVFLKQIHSSKVYLVDNLVENFSLKGDGLITNKKNLFLSIVTADCLPILFYDKKTEFIGASHAGYKGILEGVIEEMVCAFKEREGSMENTLVAIGPAIGVCCYEVGLDRLKLFIKKYKDFSFYKEKNGKYFLDLKSLASQILIEEGINKENIEISSVCTKDSLKDFYSYRGEGKKTYGEFVTVIGKV